MNSDPLHRADFGEGFAWGVATAAAQVEGAAYADGKGCSIWDTFGRQRNAIRDGHNALTACDFYHRYADDVQLLRALRIPNFRFSVAWSRVLPQGIGQANPAGLDYYDRLIDACLAAGVTPWVTLYHWDLPQPLEDQGGWTNRAVVGWFLEFAELCVRRYGDRVRHWMVLNEPMVFTGAGYFLGLHAPGRRGLPNFLPAVHHATLAQAEGGRLVRALRPDAQIGTTFSCSHIDPASDRRADQRAARRADALLNRLFVEPALGMGYPAADLPTLRRLEPYVKAHDEARLAFDFDFIGIQNYTREVVQHAPLVPYLRARIVPAPQRGVPVTDMDWEVYPPGIYHLLKKYGSYPNVPPIVVTENGAAFPDTVTDEGVADRDRIEFLQDYLAQVRRAQRAGVDVRGYFVWTFHDNFEWAEGYHPRFGLVHTDFETQERQVKDSGYWYRDFLGGR